MEFMNDDKLEGRTRNLASQRHSAGAPSNETGSLMDYLLCEWGSLIVDYVAFGLIRGLLMRMCTLPTSRIKRGNLLARHEVFVVILLI